MTLSPCAFHPRVTVVVRKRPRSFYQKCRWQVTPKHAYNLDPTKSERAHYAAVQARAHTQLVRQRLATVVSARRAAMDLPWHKVTLVCAS